MASVYRESVESIYPVRQYQMFVLPPSIKIYYEQLFLFKPLFTNKSNCGRTQADLILSYWVYKLSRAQVAELADAHGSGPCTGNGVRVQVSPWAQIKNLIIS